MKSIKSNIQRNKLEAVTEFESLKEPMNFWKMYIYAESRSMCKVPAGVRDLCEVQCPSHWVII